MANCKENEERAHKTHCIGEKVEIKTILASSFLSDHSNIIINTLILHITCTKWLRLMISLLHVLYSLMIFIIN